MLRHCTKICGAKAPGNFILVEMLTAQESMSTKLQMPGNAKAPPQGYIIDIGPMVDAEKFGFKLSDRVLLQGTYIPVPNYRISNERELGIVSPHDIKCILVESDE